ncbi:hypothetical protein D5S19_18350 [Amycolatopsis panacis]|uniref:Glycosyl transferase n=2 Tax=Amycolatopsis panacis TaxID=2340917 RepID=A0A419I269_9PSEU|nr:hypothetical protein D5S19_18350 [Amycolatopsis panacis]
MLSESAHITFMTVPLHGHVNPLLGMVTELVARGHRVSFAINDDFASLAKDAGASVVLYESTFPSSSSPERGWLEAGHDAAQAAKVFRDEFVSVLPQLETAYAGDEPDLVVYDTVAAHAPVLAAAWGVPEVQISPTHVFYDGVEAETGATVALGDRRLGLRRKPCVVTIPRSVQLHADRVGGGCQFVGPIVSPRRVDGTWTAPDDWPVVLVSLGSAYNKRPEFFSACAAAFEGTGWRVVMSIGRFFDPAELGELPPNVEVHPWVPQLDVLASAKGACRRAG